MALLRWVQLWVHDDLLSLKNNNFIDPMELLKIKQPAWCDKCHKVLQNGIRQLTISKQLIQN